MAQDLDHVIAGCAAAHQRLLGTVDGITDEVAHGPSRLPDWTVGHVLTHVARNADSIVRVFEAAAGGEVVDRYEHGSQGRNADIEHGAGRPAADLIDDVRSTIWRLEQTWAGATPEAWQGRSGEPSGKVIPVARLPFSRWREVEIHHADLGLDFSIDDWSAEYVAAELEVQLPQLADRLPADATETPAQLEDRLRTEVGDRRLLAWLVGRWTRPDLPALPAWG
jgi:maleylpyruvate isomerase